VADGGSYYCVACWGLSGFFTQQGTASMTLQAFFSNPLINKENNIVALNLL